MSVKHQRKKPQKKENGRLCNTHNMNVIRVVVGSIAKMAEKTTRDWMIYMGERFISRSND